MPDVRNCKKCGKIFSYFGGELFCLVCKEKDETDFRRVKDYLYKYPGATISQVSTELDISVERIKAYLRDGRLEISGSHGNLVLECENCGKAINTGRYCDDCTRDMTNRLKETARKMMNTGSGSSEQGKAATGIRYLSRDDKKK